MSYLIHPPASGALSSDVPTPDPRHDRRGFVLSELRLLYLFVRDPSRELPTSSHRWRSLSLFVAVSVALSLLVGLPLILVFDMIHSVEAIDDDLTSAWELLLFAVVLAPLLEELPWRLGLSRSRLAIGGALVFQAMWLAILLSEGANAFSVVAAGSLAAFGVLQVVWLTVVRRSGPGRNLFPMIVWAGSASFGLMHLANYDPTGFDVRFVWMLPLLVAPQLIAGFIYSYIRVRLGFVFALLAHGLDNLVLTLPLAVLMVLGLA